MKRLLIATLMAVMLVTVGLVAWAIDDTGNAAVGVQVEEIAQLTVSGAPALITLTSTATTAGSLPDVQNDVSTSLAWTSNVAATYSRKITAILDVVYTTGVVLKATVGTPSSGTSTGSTGGQLTLDATTAQDMWTGITNENCSGATITYEFSLSTMIAPITTTESHTVTWTLTAAAL